MLGRKKEGEKKQKWFFKVENLDDAHRAMKISYQTFYALAAIQGVIIGALVAFSTISPINLLDPMLMVFLAWLIHLRQSRTAAIILLMYTLYVSFLTLMSRLGIPHSSFGGRNIVLAAIAIYGAYKGIQGTFKFHALSRTEVIWKNVFTQTSVIFAYVVLCLGATFSLAFIPGVDPYLFGTEGKTALSDDTLGLIIITPIAAIIIAGAFRVLPGTRTRELVTREQTDINKMGLS